MSSSRRASSYASRAAFFLILAVLHVALEVNAQTCSAAGVGRSAFRDHEAVQWLESENVKRAPYYIEQAKRMFEKGLRQQKGIDRTNSDPFIALYDAQHQVLAAIDLAPNNASTWFGAGQATAMIASLDEDSSGKLSEARSFFAQSCTLDSGYIDRTLAWASEKVPDEFKKLTKVKKAIHKGVSKWKSQNKIPSTKLDQFLPTLMARDTSDVCAAQGAPMSPRHEASSNEGDPQEKIKLALASMTVRPIFPTLITTVNVHAYMGKAFTDKLAKIAMAKYKAFSAEAKRRGKKDPNDINDNFFSAQATGENQHLTPQAQAFWPELYNSKEYLQLQKFMKEALHQHAAQTGYALTPSDKDRSKVVLWAAVYLSDGTRHGYHVHQGSLSSCVFYAQSPGSKTPIMFIDPRGAPPIHDYEQHLGERDFEPMAPFHHNYNLFAEAGDLVCFPSWLVHRVPSHFEQEPRVAFPANLQADGFWDAWYRSATLP